MKIEISTEATNLFPGVCCGFLAVTHASNPAQSSALEARKEALTATLREQYGAPADASAIKNDPVILAYSAYYKRFKKSYHVGMQLESVVFKGRSIPAVAALVESMFMAELEDRLLTAGHDLNALEGDILIAAAHGDETYTVMRGEPQTLKANDLYMRDGQGVISSIIYGPDQRTQITPLTTEVLFTVYAPPGVGRERVAAHLERIWEYVQISSPEAQVLFKQVVE